MNEALDAHVQLSGLGAVARLEARLCAMHGTRFALAVSSATSGLLALGLALGLRGSDFVTTPYTWGGTSAPWRLAGARPIFADIDPATMALSPTAAASAATGRTRAILATDIYGVPCDTAALREVADRRALWLVVDAAQSLGARRNGRSCLVAAHAAVLSFGSGKTADAGEGGAILTDDPDVYERVLTLSQHPRRQGRELGLDRATELAPLNARIHPFTAAFLDVTWEAVCDRIGARQREGLALARVVNTTGLAQHLPFAEEGILPSFERFTAAWQDGPAQDALCARLAEAGITVRVSPAPTRLVYRQRGYRPGRGVPLPHCPQAEDQAGRRFAIELAGPAAGASA